MSCSTTMYLSQFADELVLINSDCQYGNKKTVSTNISMHRDFENLGFRHIRERRTSRRWALFESDKKEKSKGIKISSKKK